MQFSYIFALFVAVGSVAALPAPAENVALKPVALDGTTDEQGRMLRIFRMAAVKKNKAQLENDRLAPAPKVEPPMES
ncbi:hypothetical protein AOL_s00215g495 [Orbilia oligospora ATCC 24927]|uniref:Uncharacterized protein n=2 Tax=Orbilia oligospora TaxID=2813651 RepID=G1XSZ7_ARTOA|nr:hypothetical protein AOL_s00215g495 [Orbilia oligospora ATCC 24927]EGX43759.1 hypothetical protein AOL_s00215g495 [Orbilia oligospora ATCC 24927]KAF3274587.1 hypothetical protein TWF970_007847 [Orbilia oligospora]